jgi:hypothetical protein
MSTLGTDCHDREGVRDVSKVSFFRALFRRARRRSERARTVAGHPARLEVLEGRALLSHASVPRIAAADVLAPPRPADPHPGPIKNLIGTGHAVKISRLYPYYTGAKLGQINGAGALAYNDGQGNLVLTGIVAGTIVTVPSDSTQSQFYVFGINRGNAAAVAPFPGRRGVMFDSYVEVSVQPTGVSAQFVDLAKGTTTNLPASNVILGSDVAKVAVPLSILGNTTITPTVNFWTQDVQQVGDYHHISSFTPEFRNFPVAPRPLSMQ